MKNKIIEIGNIVKTASKWNSPQRGRIYSTDGVAPTICKNEGGNLTPKILEVYGEEEVDTSEIQ